MLNTNDVIHGWSPAGNDDVEVNVSQEMCFMAIKPITSSSAFLSPICPPLDTTLPKACSPQSRSTPVSQLLGITHTLMAPSSGRRAQRNRIRDPSWVPRPRNAFIIFRCEYSREHAQGVQESQSNHDSVASVKSLSKCAAEAWKQLPASKKDHYRMLADKEREEHARLYPHYRFRPMKRQGSAARRSSGERSQSPKGGSVESRPAPSAHVPSVLSAAPVKPRSHLSVAPAEVSAPVPQVTVTPPLEASYPTESCADPEVPFGLDPSDSVLFYPSPEASLSSDLSPSSASVELYSPLFTSAVATPLDSLRCSYSTCDRDRTHDGLERAQALEAYAIGLYNHDLFSPFSFPEYY